jgi:putative endonuclease
MRIREQALPHAPTAVLITNHVEDRMTTSEDPGASGGEHHVYVVKCSDGSYYTGYTTDVERRVAEHNAGDGAKYTRGRRPVTLVHVEAFDSQSRAMQREYAIKQLSRTAKERIVDEENEDGG